MSLLLDIVAKIRSSNTVFGQRVAGVLTLNMGEDMIKFKDHPYALICPILENASPKASDKMQGDYVQDEVTRLRGYAIAAIFKVNGDLEGSSAAVAAELGVEQLITSLVNWKPGHCFGSTVYDGMRIGEGSSVEGIFLLTFTFIEYVNVQNLNQDMIEGDLFTAPLLKKSDIQVDMFRSDPNPPPEDCTDKKISLLYGKPPTAAK